MHDYKKLQFELPNSNVGFPGGCFHMHLKKHHMTLPAAKTTILLSHVIDDFTLNVDWLWRSNFS